MTSLLRPNNRIPGALLPTLALILFLGMTEMSSGETAVRVVYPKPNQLIGAIDSTFIFGHIAGEYDREHDWLDINGRTVEIHEDGGFLAFLPIEPGPFEFHLRLMRPRKLPLSGNVLDRFQLLAETVVPVQVPLPSPPIPEDSLLILGDYQPPPGNLFLRTGDRLRVFFRGTPDMKAWFSIPGVVDSVPMSETDPRQQPYWGEAVFGAGAVPDSVLVRGVYSGFYEVAATATADSVTVGYHLAAPPAKYLRPVSATDSTRTSDSVLLEASGAKIKGSSRYKVSLNSSEYPFTVRFLDSVQTLRYGPTLGYFAIFQPAGVEALAVGRIGDWYRLQLSRTHFAWASVGSVIPLEKGILPPESRLASVRSYSAPDHVLIEFGLSGKHPFRVFVDDRRTVRIQLFGVTSNTDWIRYDFDDDLVALATWSQPEDGLYEFKLQLNRDLWGYDTYYEGNRFLFRLNRAPEKVKNLWGKTVVVDPGHASDPGSIGPTGLTEAEANLGIALALRDELQKRGAIVVMTRDDMSHVSLYDRPSIAKAAGADLFVSVHNNALPDGVNPFANHGVSTYYYHPQAIELARAIQGELMKATKMPDFGLYHGNLAVNRPTQYPAVLVECAFMIIPEHEAMLKTERYRKKVAEAIRKGIEKFLKDYDSRNR